MTGADGTQVTDTEESARSALVPLLGYFLKLGTLGFGGPVALAGYMQRDLVEERRWVSDEDYKLAFALAQISPGPMAAQLAIALGYFTHGVLGATLVGLVFVLPSFLMVLALAVAYVAFGGFWWMQALFYGIGAAVIGIIAIAAYKLARKINGRDPLLWGVFATLAVTTIWAQAELAELFLIAGLLVLLVQTPPRWLKAHVPFLNVMPGALLVPVPFPWWRWCLVTTSSGTSSSSSSRPVPSSSAAVWRSFRFSTRGLSRTTAGSMSRSLSMPSPWR